MPRIRQRSPSLSTELRSKSRRYPLPVYGTAHCTCSLLKQESHPQTGLGGALDLQAISQQLLLAVAHFAYTKWGQIGGRKHRTWCPKRISLTDAYNGILFVKRNYNLSALQLSLINSSNRWMIPLASFRVVGSNDGAAWAELSSPASFVVYSFAWI
jgi:hypothetical protein